MKKLISLILLVSLVACSSSEPAKPLSPEEMAARFQALGSPGEQHQQLSVLEGKWKAKSKFWLDPTQAPEQSEATASRKWILDGRFLQELYVDKNPRAPFEGIGVIGFDKVQEVFISNWMDTMGTGIARSQGKVSEDGKVFSFVGEQACPVTGAVLKNRSTLSILGENQTKLEMFQTTIEGSEQKVLEIEYQRIGS